MIKILIVEDEINIAIKGAIVDSNASKDLKRIRKHISLCEEKIQEKLNKFIKNPGNREYIQEFFIDNHLFYLQVHLS